MNGLLKIISIFLVLLLSQYIIAQDNKVKVDYTSDFSRVMKNGDSTYMMLTGNVYLYHNGAIISCDTAYYYGQTNRFVGIRNVILNQDSLYIYGDRFVYSEDDGLARVFSPLVKVVDSATVMYTRNLIYNTATSVARFFGGATVEHNDNKLESVNGFYDSGRRVVLLRDSVVVDNPDYEAKTDSLDFYLDTEELFFECRTYMWRTNGDFLQSDKGTYNKLQEVFHCEENSYVMTKDQEVWADTISYYSLIDELILKSNIQMLDTVKKMYAFGDYGQYWKDSENVLLTKTPSIINYFENSTDTLFLSSDTLFIRPFIKRTKRDSLLSDSVKTKMDNLSRDIAIDKNIITEFGGELKDGEIPISGAIESILADSLKVDSNIVDTLKLDTLKLDSLAKDTLQIDSILVRDSVVNIKDVTRKGRKEYKKKLREEKKLARKMRFIEWLKEGGMDVIIDTVRLDSASIDIDSLIDTTKVDSLLVEKVIKVENVPDSSDYIIRGYSTSKIYRNDVQMICDTLISETVDSTTTFIGEPIMWNENNQITAERIRTFTKNQELYRARLFNKPIVAQAVEPGVYNQMKGDYMDAMFRDNSIYRLYVFEASEVLNYKVDETPDKYVQGLTFATSVKMIIDIDSTEIRRIKFYPDIETITYPIEQVPATQHVILQGFAWWPEYKPTKKDIFNRSIRVPYRQEAVLIKKPVMRITDEIERLKKSLIQKNVWKDRTDIIPDEQRHFLGAFNLD